MHGFQLSFFLKIQYIPMVFVTYCLIKFKLMFISDICKTLKISMDSIHLDFGVIGAKCYKFTKLKHINSTRLLPSITDARLIMRIHCSEVLFEWEQHHCSICTFCVYFVSSKIGKICKKNSSKKNSLFFSPVCGMPGQTSGDLYIPLHPPRHLPEVFRQDHPDGAVPTPPALTLRRLPLQDQAPWAGPRGRPSIVDHPDGTSWLTVWVDPTTKNKTEKKCVVWEPEGQKFISFHKELYSQTCL